MTHGDQSLVQREYLAGASATAAAFGTFGELLQGALPDGQEFLVTLPIARWSRATFRLDSQAGTVCVRPAHKNKSRRLVLEMLRERGIDDGGELVIDSDLPEGKGLASSSADLVATARAVGRALGTELGAERIETLLRLIEPSDGVMYDGIVAFHHRQVRLRTHLGHLPPMTVVGIDEGGIVDTTDFNLRPKSFSAREKRTYEQLLGTLTCAIATADVASIGAVATHSALMNQRRGPKRHLDDLITLCREVGGLGVVAAHSGTALGVLLADDDPGHVLRLERTRRACAGLAGVTWTDRCLPAVRAADRLGGYLSTDARSYAVP